MEQKNNLPNGWVKTILDNLSTKIHYGYTAKSIKEGIGPKYLRITDIQNNSVNWDKVPNCQISSKKLPGFLLEPNNLVFARTGATVGKSFLIKEPPNAVFASYLIRIILSKSIYANYVNYFFKSDLYWQQIHSGNVGIAQPNFNASKLSKIQISLPPLSEQKRIVAKIESIFSRIDAAKVQLETLASQAKSSSGSLNILKSSVLKQAFEGRLVPQDPNDEHAEMLLQKIHKDSKNELEFEKKDLPEGWLSISLRYIALLINGRAFKPEDWSDEGLPIVRIQNLNDHCKPFNYCNFKIDKKFLINNGQILFAWSGTPRTSFGCFIWNRGKAVLNQHIFRVEIDESHLDKQFICYAINQNLDKYINKAHGGVGLRHITKGKFEEEVIPLPPLPEQKRIVAKIESIFGRIDAICFLIHVFVLFITIYFIHILMQFLNIKF